MNGEHVTFRWSDIGSPESPGQYPLPGHPDVQVTERDIADVAKSDFKNPIVEGVVFDGLDVTPIIKINWLRRP